METACALWSVVLAPQFPLVTDITEFFNVGCEVVSGSCVLTRFTDYRNLQRS